MEQAVFESVRYSAMCQDCGAELECCGVQALVDGRLRWDVESTCSACGFAVAVCGGDLPSERRDQMLSEHGPARLQVVSPSAKSVVMMRVLRVELGIDLVNAKAVLRRVLSGDYSGTLPEMELLARKLRASGIAAVATRS
jgi:tRNA G26 N,N-dimethylase Trm1